MPERSLEQLKRQARGAGGDAEHLIKRGSTERADKTGPVFVAHSGARIAVAHQRRKDIAEIEVAKNIPRLLRKNAPILQRAGHGLDPCGRKGEIFRHKPGGQAALRPFLIKIAGMIQKMHGSGYPDHLHIEKEVFIERLMRKTDLMLLQQRAPVHMIALIAKQGFLLQPQHRPVHLLRRFAEGGRGAQHVPADQRAGFIIIIFCNSPDRLVGGRLRQPRGHAAEERGIQQIVCIREGQIMPPGQIDSPVSRRPCAAVFREMDYADPRVCRRQTVAEGAGLIGGAIVDEDQFIIGKITGLDTPDVFFQVLRAVINRHDDAEKRRLIHDSFSFLFCRALSVLRNAFISESRCSFLDIRRVKYGRPPME